VLKGAQKLPAQKWRRLRLAREQPIPLAQVNFIKTSAMPQLKIH
jgi:hypothetical protein